MRSKSLVRSYKERQITVKGSDGGKSGEVCKMKMLIKADEVSRDGLGKVCEAL